MQRVKGTGPALAATVCALLPESGTISDKTISAFVSPAPEQPQRLA